VECEGVGEEVVVGFGGCMVLNAAHCVYVIFAIMVWYLSLLICKSYILYPLLYLLCIRGFFLVHVLVGLSTKLLTIGLLMDI